MSSAQELKDHAFFTEVDWTQVYQQKYPPPLIPPRGEVNAADAFDIGSFDEEDTKGIKVKRLLLCSVLSYTLPAYFYLGQPFVILHRNLFSFNHLLPRLL